MDMEADADNTDARNFLVTGDQSEQVYGGSVVRAEFDQVFNGQTVEQFQSGIFSDPADGPAQLPAEDEEVSVEPTEDTLVFLLDDGVRLRAGEVITVHVSQSVSVKGATLNAPIVFQFTVAGGTSAAEGSFFVTEVEPRAESSQAALSPLMRAEFSQPARAETIPSGVVVRGDQSGVHDDVRTIFDNSGGTSEQAAVRLADDDVFLPGETVSVAWTDAIQNDDDVDLAPFTSSFQVKPGFLTGLDRGARGWQEEVIATLDEDIVAVLAADFRPLGAGSELVVVTAGRLRLYLLGDGGIWESASDLLLAGVGEVRAAASVDTDDDGVPEIVIITELDGESQVRHYQISDAGQLEAGDDPVSFPALGVDLLVVADLNSDGTPELIVGHDDTPLSPEEIATLDEDAPTTTGYLTLFELGLPTIDLGNLDLSDPDSLLGRAYQRIHRPIARVERPARIGVRDLDGDGRLDVLLAGDGGVILYRNQTTSNAQFSFRRVGALTGPGGADAVYLPWAWVPADLDRDGDVDLLSWSESGAWFHENRNPDSASEADDDVPRGLLFEALTPEAATTRVSATSGARVLSSNLDGDSGSTPDLVVVQPEGTVHIVVGTRDAIFSFEPSREYGGAMVMGDPLIVDVDGDTALDVVVARGRSLRAIISETDLVEEVTPPEPSEYRPVLREEGDDVVAIEVRGDIRERFTGYSIAIDHDEGKLEYLGFERPEFFERTASFELCPTAQLLGCDGIATARMTYLQDTVGAATEDLLLGTFRFRRKTVTEVVETSILFEDLDAGESTFRNSVTVRVAGLSEERIVSEFGDPISIRIDPPPPDPEPRLAIECSVLERGDAGYTGRVVWSSPRGEAFETVKVLVGGVLISGGLVSWNSGGVDFDDASGGRVSVEVVALRAGEEPDEAPSETCELVSVFRPVVSCDSRDGKNIVEWTLDAHDVDNFRVYKNGLLVRTLGASESTYEDSNPSEEGADLYEVAGLVDSIEGPRGSCRGADPSPCETEDPEGVSAVLLARADSSSPNVVRFRWSNGEAYDRIEASLRRRPIGGGDEEDIFPGGIILDGAENELVWEGDSDRGGAVPGTYRLTVQGWVANPACPGEEAGSQVVSLDEVTVPVPSLDEVGVTCGRDGLADLTLSWDAPWRGYEDFLEIRLRHEITGEEPLDVEFRDILLSDTGYRISELPDGSPLEPFGSYSLTLVAHFDGVETTAECGPISFDPTITAPIVEAGIGEPSFEIPIVAAGVFRVVRGFEFEIEYPDFLTLHDLAPEPAGDGRLRARVVRADTFIDPDPDGDRVATGEVELIRLLASIPSDFSLAGRAPDPILITEARVLLDGMAASRPISALDGDLSVTGRYAAIDRVEVAAGSTDSIRVAVRVTFTAPVVEPDYKFNAFQLHLAFDPEVLELLPIAADDQVGTAVEDEGFYVFPDSEQLVSVNEQGAFKVGWLGFDLANPTQPAYLEPTTNQELLVLRFRSKVPVTSPDLFSSIRFVTDASADQPTAFFPVVDVPGVPDMDAFFDGGVQVSGGGSAWTLSSIEPSRGALTGGNTVRLRGRGFPLPGETLPFVHFISPQGVETEVDPAAIELVDEGEMRVEVPDSGLRAASFTGTSQFDVRLTTDTGSALLPEAYSYESPRVTAVDVRSVHAFGDDFVRIDGVGFSVDSLARFVVEGVDGVFEAAPYRFGEDGTTLVVVAAGLPAPPPDAESLTARLQLLLPDSPVITFSDPILILPALESPDLELTEVDPTSATLCGGQWVTLRGQGLGPDVVVEFGGEPALEIDYRSPFEVRAVAPAASDAGEVDLTVSLGGATDLVAFAYELPPDFVRGDIDGDGDVTMQDATLLSRIALGEASDPGTQPNHDAWDTNDDGIIDFGDSVLILEYLFASGAPPAAPYPGAGQDPDNLADGRCQ